MLATAKHVVKRAAAELAPPNTTKRQRGPPPAAALFSDVELLKRPPESKRMPATAPLVMAVYKVSDCAGDLLAEYNGASNACLFEVLMEHQASPSILHELKSSFEDYLKWAHHTALHGDAPTTLQEMGEVDGSRLFIVKLAARV